MGVHPTAMISSEAVVEEDVEIGPYSIVGPDVQIGRGTVVGPHAVIEGPTRIGANCRIFQFVSIGAPPQDLKFGGERCPVIIGDNNTIREFVTIHRATAADIAMTCIGNNNLLMAYCHVAHNCKLENNIVMANAATLAGHIHVEDYAIIGGLSGVHQFTRIGCHAMISGASAVTQDVPPYVTVAGNHARPYGLNLIGLKRRGFSEETVGYLKKAYRTIFRSSLLLSVAAEKIREEIKNSPEVDHFVEFIKKSERGVCR
ncbi:MAG: acyl-ACP--UDP-N-acetylglucosamine O-acyltransferase [Deltaproteobacteria bacterium]|nr:acyl-ACP--UDP-N-acetylglucosamine O-acyltransferase [Deltaproteobacteria bacterium]MBW2673924.1 acyl-ACP--UDP-N-acetylglucosamine O-acyltransferase [Deltaproteobacteria bacterium]